MGDREGVGDRFQKETKYDPDALRRHDDHWEPKPEPFKTVEAPRDIVELPDPKVPERRDIWELLRRRRSRRVFDASRTIGLDELAALLWASQGVTAKRGEFLFRTAPSAGALYPIETYVHARAVDQLKPGIYHFRPHLFDLEFLRDRDYSGELVEALLRQSMVSRAQVTFIWTAIPARSRWKYRQRAYRYIYLDAGHLAQNLALGAESFGLGTCMIGAFFDDQVNAIVGVDGVEETAVYLAAVGWPATT